MIGSQPRPSDSLHPEKPGARRVVYVIAPGNLAYWSTTRAMPPQQPREIERTVHKSRDFKAATEWDVHQHLSLSPQERLRAARTLKERAFPSDAPDVRECHRTE